MPDAQNLSCKPLAVTSILQKKAFDKLYRVIPFPVVHSMDAEVMLILILFSKKKCEGTLFVMLQFIRAVSFKKVNLPKPLS